MAQARTIANLLSCICTLLPVLDSVSYPGDRLLCPKAPPLRRVDRAVCPRPGVSITNFFGLNLPWFHALAVFLPRLGSTSMLLLNRVRKYALLAKLRIRTCWPASVAFQVVLILLGGC